MAAKVFVVLVECNHKLNSVLFGDFVHLVRHFTEFVHHMIPMIINHVPANFLFNQVFSVFHHCEDFGCHFLQWRNRKDQNELLSKIPGQVTQF